MGVKNAPYMSFLDAVGLFHKCCNFSWLGFGGFLDTAKIMYGSGIDFCLWSFFGPCMELSLHYLVPSTFSLSLSLACLCMCENYENVKLDLKSL